ncbi:MAG TPA: glycosyltransferase, partial [Pyrinomonadaceae bacterium]|nr:glycosyltransferase [Pyrinomonadaceae bacterium]
MANKEWKSVHLTNYYHKNSGGISTSYNNLLAAAEKRRKHIRLIVPGEKEDAEWVNSFARIYYIPAPQSPIFDKRYRIILPWQYMQPASLIRKIIIEEKPDFIEVTDKYTISMMGAMIRRGKFRQAGRPALIHFSCERMDDNVESFIGSKKLGRFLSRNIVGNYLLPSFDYHIANSSYTAEEFYQALKERKDGSKPSFLARKSDVFFRNPQIDLKDRIFVCPRGVDTTRFTPDKRSSQVRKSLLDRCKADDGAVLLLYSGRISPEKNIPLLIETFRKLIREKKGNYYLFVAGDGPLKEKFEKENLESLQQKVYFLGHLDKETLAQTLANVDIFIHPNPKEPFGIAPLEAMASGIPVVAPNSGGILSYANSENAWLVEPFAEKFVAAIEEI